ncbi:hypothetical protein Tco_1437434 [Tanacetum coccineum]
MQQNILLQRRYKIVLSHVPLSSRDRNVKEKGDELNEIHKFSDGPLKRVMDKLDQHGITEMIADIEDSTSWTHPNDDEEGTPVFREGSVHQPCYGDDLIQPRFDEHIPNSRHDSIIRHSVHDGLHTTTPVGEENQFEGNVGTSI